ncbi:lipase family protein [Nocardia paucivorans]|uniref:lipase family protein n=1 Tax=Nocardia paucivorans TaxID=114259 RepID=UPI0012F9EBA1
MPVLLLQAREILASNTASARGWSAVSPDHLGPTFSFDVTRHRRQITLDGIPATRAASPRLKRIRVTLAGYSRRGPTLLRFRWAGAAEVTMTPEHILRRFSVFPRSRCGSRGVSAVTPHRRTVEIAVRQLGTAPPYRRPPPVSPRRRRAHVNRPWTKRSESGSEAFTAPL